MENSLKIKINNLYNTKVDGVQDLHYDAELVKKIIQDDRFTFDEIIDILIADNQLLDWTYNNDSCDDESCDDESFIYNFMCNNGKKLTSKHIERFFACDSSLLPNDKGWLLLCGGQSLSLISEIANNLGIELSTKYILGHLFVYDRGCVNLFEFQNMSEYIEDNQLQEALKLRTFDNDVLDVILHKIIVYGIYSSEIIKYLCIYQQLTKDLVVKYKDYLDWVSVSSYQEFDAIEYIDYNFFREIKDYMVWNIYVSRNPVSEKLYKLFADKLPWDEFKKRQQVLIDFKDVQLNISDLKKMHIDEYNKIFCHKVVMTPKLIKLVRKYHKILLYRNNNSNNNLLDKIMLLLRCGSYFDKKLRNELKTCGFQIEGDYVIGFVQQECIQTINSRTYEHGLSKSYTSRCEIIHSDINEDYEQNIKVKVNIHDIHSIDYYVWPSNKIKQITTNKFEFLY